MLNPDLPRDRIIASSLELAKLTPWHQISLAEIAAHAQVSLSELRGHFDTKRAILAAFAKAVDDHVLAGADLKSQDSRRDRLFDILMARFDALAPYKAALARIVDDNRRTFGADSVPVRDFLSSQYWMLAAAGIAGDGLTGGMRVAGLASLYAQTFDVWLSDDDPGLAKTMAALDRRLRRAERWAKRADAIRDRAARMTAMVSRRSPTRGTAPDQPTTVVQGTTQ